MLAQQILFYIFASIVIISAFGVITSRNSVKAVLFLVLAFVASSAIWLMLEAEFLALVLIVVYVGAVMVLFLFVVMMLNVKRESTSSGFVRYWPLAGLCGVLVMIMLAWVVGPQHFGLATIKQPTPEPANYSNITVLGVALFTEYVYPFILAAALLLAAMICAIVLTHRPRKKDAKAQIPARQIATNPKDRIRIIKMPSEGKS